MSKMINHPFTKQPQPGAVQKSQGAILARQVAAFDAMCAARPLKPPPMRLLPAVFSPAKLALMSDIRHGVAA